MRGMEVTGYGMCMQKQAKSVSILAHKGATVSRHRPKPVARWIWLRLILGSRELTTR